MIDEVQKIPRLLDVVHRMIEQKKVKFALTGSSARKLKRGGANLLAGRAVERILLPFCSVELKDQFSLSQAAAQMNAKIINHSAIERDAHIPRKQSERHFEILADTLIGRYLHPFHKSIRKRQTQKAKFYFFDTGVLRAIQRSAGLELEASTYEYGSIFETFLINEIFKLESALLKRWDFSYFQTSDQRQIDLIIEKPKGSPVLIDIKSTRQIKSEHVSYFEKIKNEIRHSQAYLLSQDRESKEIGGIRCLYWLDGLTEIFELSSSIS